LITLPHQPIMARLTSGGQGAAPCVTLRSEERLYLRFTSSGSRNRRTNIVGTMCMCVTRCRSIRRSMSSASKRGCSTVVIC
jgi:hypothetical protein